MAEVEEKEFDPKNPADIQRLNEMIAAEAQKQGLDVKSPQPRAASGKFVKTDAAAPAASAAEPTEKEQVHERTVVIGGKEMSFRGATPESVLEQVSAALTAVAATAPAAEVKEDVPAKPALSQDEMFEIGLRIQRGDATAIDEYLTKSGAVDKYFESRGVNVADIKATTEARQSDTLVAGWQNATKEFLEASGNDWPGGNGNLKLIGYKLAELGLEKDPSAKNLQTAYAALKAEGTILPGAPLEKQETTETVVEPPPKKKLGGSSAFGTGAEPTTRQPKNSPNALEAKWQGWLKANPNATRDEVIAAYNGLMSEAVGK